PGGRCAPSRLRPRVGGPSPPGRPLSEPAARDPLLQRSGSMTARRPPSSFPSRVCRAAYSERPHRFGGSRIGLTYKDSKPDYPRLQKAPDGARNGVLVLLDAVGLGWPSTYGGLVRTPTADRLAGIGLPYCQFHTTALCAHTRAAL